MSVCLSVRPSVRLCVTLVYCGYRPTPKENELVLVWGQLLRIIDGSPDPSTEIQIFPTVKAYVHTVGKTTSVKSAIENLRPQKLFDSFYVTIGHLSSCRAVVNLLKRQPPFLVYFAALTISPRTEGEKKKRDEVTERRNDGDDNGKRDDS